METEPHLFERIKREYFIDPAPDDPDAYIGRVQAVLSVLIGNMLEWYVVGAGYTPLKEALAFQLQSLQATTVKLARESGEQRKKSPRQLPQDDRSPFVIAPDWGRDRINLPYRRQGVGDLKEALRIVDADTGGAIRFNHHFIGELHPQGNIIALAASVMATFLNENVVIPKVSPSVTTWEKEVVEWVWSMLRQEPPREGEGGTARAEDEPYPDPEDGSGRIVVGGTVANLTAMFIARERFREWCAKAGKRPADVRPVLLYSPHAHYSIKKAARIVGFVYDQNPALSEIVRIDGRNYWYITADDVAQAIQAANTRGQFVVMVSALAGATDTGYVDDLDGIADVVAEYNTSVLRAGPEIYYHIDAAMGGPFRLLQELKWERQQKDLRPARKATKYREDRKADSPLFEGIQRGDAVTIDGHKYFYCNYPCGGIFVRRESDFNCLHEDARYLESGESETKEPKVLTKLYKNLLLDESPMSDLESEWRDRRGLRTLEGSRGIIGITQLYCTLKAFGTDGLGALLQHTLDMTDELRRLIRKTKEDTTRPALELITSGPLNQTLFRVVTKWDSRTDPAQIGLDNEINLLLPYYANWMQTGKLNERLKALARTAEVDEVLGILRPLPFYVGTDQLLSHLPDNDAARAEVLGAFLDYVWRINGKPGGCPPQEKLDVQRWLSSAEASRNSSDDKVRGLQVLKAVITHPYTDEGVLERYVNAIRDGAQVVLRVLEKEGAQAARPVI